MNARDYVIVPDGHNWAALLKDWRPLLPIRYTVWMANLFGHVFVILDDESVHVLDIEMASFDRLAKSREEFRELLKQNDNFNQWYMAVLVDRCVDAGMSLKSGQCYGFVIPTILGGAYDVNNIKPMPMTEYYGFTASIHAQTKDLPDGTKVVLKVVD